MKIYFARHGESTANEIHEISNRGLKAPLTRKGRLQAVKLAASLQDAHISRIYSSPLLRALETSVIVAHLLAVDYEVADALREYDCGILEGRSDEEAWRQWRELHDAWVKENRLSYRLVSGESLDDLCDRFLPFVEKLLTGSSADAGNLLCVSHGGLYRLMLPRVLINVDQSFVARMGFDYTDSIEAEAQPTGLRCIRWNGVEPQP